MKAVAGQNSESLVEGCAVFDVQISENERTGVQKEIYKCWKVCTAFLMPKGMKLNSNSPNGVITAVFGMPSIFISTWKKPSSRSALEKIFAPCKFVEMSCIRQGYLSGTVTEFSWR